MDILQAALEKQLAEFQPEAPTPLPPEPPGFWQNLRALKRTEAPPAYHVRQWQDIETFRRTVAARLRSYMAEVDPKHMLLIPAPPGSGKTWAGVDFAHWVYETTQHRVLYAGPRKEFYGDILDTAVRQNLDLNLWYDWKARQSHETDIELHNCNHIGKITEWMQMGYEGMNFCSTVCGWDYVNGGCKYHAQKERTEPLVYGHHMHVTLGHPLAKEFAVVVGDELPIDAFVREWTIPPSRVKFADVPLEWPLSPMLYDLNRLCAMGITNPQSGPELLQQMGGAEAIRDAIDDEVLALFSSAQIAPPPLNSNGDLDRIPANYLPTFLPILKAEATAAAAGHDYPHRLSVDKSGLTILTRRQVNPQYKSHMIWFDATGTEALYRTMFGRDVEVLDAQPRPAGRIFQVTDRANGKSSIIRRDKDKETGELGEPTETNRAGQLRAQIAKICSGYSNPAIITYQALEESLADQGHQSVRHFYGSRGTNDFEECDVLVVAGTPMIPIPAIIQTAKCLWPERMRPFDATFSPVDRAYQHTGDDGEGYAYPVSQFTDPDLNTLLWQRREGEIVQSAHRSRMLSRLTDVYLLTNIPIEELPPNRLMTIRELFGAPEGVDVFKWGAVVEFIEGRDFVTSPDLVDGMGINREAANKYLGIFVEQYGWSWQVGIRRPGARGPAPKTIGKPK